MQKNVSVQDMVDTLQEMKIDFEEKALMYNKIERKWRSAMFRIACIMGVLPIISGSATMLPEDVGPWFALAISLINVTIVIVNTKMDMGERIADAAMAGKGYDKLATTIGFMLTEVKMGKNVEINSKLVECKSITDSILANISYPESVKKGGLMSMLCEMCPCMKNTKVGAAGASLAAAGATGASLSSMKPDDVMALPASATSDAMKDFKDLKGSASAAADAQLKDLKGSTDAQMKDLKGSASAAVDAKASSLKDAASAKQEEAMAKLPTDPTKPPPTWC